ncbi:uncharacterized protein UDID_19355 [Ustilago sp. UG-2017a]|nr:uncharacterized protein UDID_19355 [Ustilago sp. UG-2017a]
MSIRGCEFEHVHAQAVAKTCHDQNPGRRLDYEWKDTTKPTRKRWDGGASFVARRDESLVLTNPTIRPTEMLQFELRKVGTQLALVKRLYRLSVEEKESCTAKVDRERGAVTRARLSVWQLPREDATGIPANEDAKKQKPPRNHFFLVAQTCVMQNVGFTKANGHS